MVILTQIDIHELTRAVISARLQNRDALLATIDPFFCKMLPLATSPGEQVLCDLDNLNKTGALADGSIPLVAWLRNAISLTSSQVEEAVFLKAIGRIYLSSLGERPTDDRLSALLKRNTDLQAENAQLKEELARARRTSTPPERPARSVRPAPERVELLGSFPTQEFKMTIAGATHVRILQTFIPIVLHMNLFEREMVRAIQGGCCVDVLLCNPWSPACHIRQIALDGARPIDVRGEIERNLRHFGAIFNELPQEAHPRLSVRVYSTLPSMSIYQVDDTFYGGNYFHGTLAIEGPQFKVTSRDSQLGQSLKLEYQRIWEHRTTQPARLDDVGGWLREGPTEQPLRTVKSDEDHESSKRDD